MAHLSLIPRMWLRKHGISTNTRSELTIYQQEVFDNDSVSLGTSPNIPSPWKPFTGFGCTLFSDKLKIVTACYSVCWDVKFIEMPQGLHISPHIYISSFASDSIDRGNSWVTSTEPRNGPCKMIHGSSYGGQYAFAKNSHGSYWNKMYPAVIKHCKGQITTREKGLKVKHQTTQTIFTTVVIICTIWLFNIAMENDPFIDGLPIKNCDFPWLCYILRW
jgi:hypothetical protein